MAKFKLCDWFTQSQPVTYPLMVWGVVILTTLINVWVFSLVIPHAIHHVRTGGIANSLSDWDSQWWVSVAKGGYSELQSTAFFPLFPLLISTVHHITHWSYNLSGVVISNVAYLFSLIFFYKLILERMDIDIARRALWLLVMFPTAMFFNVAYSESITLLTTVLFFYLLNKDHWYAAMIAGCVATTTHTLGGVLLIVGLCYLVRHRQQLSHKKFWIRFFSLGIIVSGLLAYMIFLWAHFGSPFAFLAAEKYWHRGFSYFPLYAALYVFRIITHPSLFMDAAHQFYLSSAAFVNLVNALSALWFSLLAIIAIKYYRKHPLMTLEMKLFFTLTLLASVMSGTNTYFLQSYSRFMAVLFPAFIIWASTFRNSTFFLVSLSIMIPIKTILLGFFIGGYWIT